MIVIFTFKMIIVFKKKVVKRKFKEKTGVIDNINKYCSCTETIFIVQTVSWETHGGKTFSFN